jgi:hypothetical protein
VDAFAGLLVLTLLLIVAFSAGAASVFRITHWRDWPDRWPDAHPAVSWVLLSDLFVRQFFRDRSMPRSRREAILWEAPSLFIAGCVVVAVVLIGLNWAMA